MKGDPRPLADEVQTNGVFDFVSIVEGRESPTMQDLERVMTWYDQAFKARPLEDIAKEIRDYRGS
jgi:hypothetical protein